MTLIFTAAGIAMTNASMPTDSARKGLNSDALEVGAIPR